MLELIIISYKFTTNVLSYLQEYIEHPVDYIFIFSFLKTYQGSIS